MKRFVGVEGGGGVPSDWLGMGERRGFRLKPLEPGARWFSGICLEGGGLGMKRLGS